MAVVRAVISTLSSDGKEAMGPDMLMFHYPDSSIVSGTLLTVESNHFAVLKSRGAVLDIYETGQYPIQTPDKPLLGSFTQAFFGGQSPWQYEVLYVNRTKMVVKTSGLALSREMAEMAYEVDYYFHVAKKEDALALVTHMPQSGHFVTTAQVNTYAGPVVEQAINQIVQLTPLESVNEKIHEITQLVHDHLQQFLTVFGITLDTVKVLVFPKDERMRQLISLKAFGLSELDAVRYYAAILMAERGVISAPNMALGIPFSIGGIPQVQVPLDPGSGGAAPSVPKTVASRPSPPPQVRYSPPPIDDPGQEQ
ncbi:MAG TPA: SPFH domain-containing protein [Candidatus Sulfotelmatobacter sp.]|nr:SPFH domain-containing protein [Candidatus Sulfotelmatobacter sp.]